jgi:serine/threonine protein kinase
MPLGGPLGGLAISSVKISRSPIRPLTGAKARWILARPDETPPATMLPRSHRAPLDELASPTLKKYRLLGQLAKGGMAEVFLAQADGLGGFERLLVIKRILPELASDTEFVRMFLDEARIAATLHHTNIVQVREVDIADGQVFYAMEHLHGQDVATTLQRLTERGVRMPLGNAIAIIAAVAAGLHYAHERCGSDGQPLGIVHRDVAPNNVIVTYDGNVKLIDFGIAKAANNLSRTRFGLFKGKLPYASPEQCRCELVDRRTDVFSLGVLLYELTTGHRLFTADNEYELIRVVSEAVVPRPRLRDKAYPRDLEAIVLKALAQGRDDRYPSAQALQCDLEAFASRTQLDLSAMSLSRLMERLFADELTQWRSAERAGVTLEQHIITTTNKLGLDRATAGGPHDELDAEAASEVTRPSRRPLPRRIGASDATDPPGLADPSRLADPIGIDPGGIDPGGIDPGGIDPGGIAGSNHAIGASVAGPTAVARPSVMPGAMVFASVQPVTVMLPMAPSRKRSPVAKYALIAVAATGLVGAGALGARWLSEQPSPPSTVPAAQPGTPELAPGDPATPSTGQAAVAPAPSAPEMTQTPPATEPAPRPASIEPASRPPAASIQPATTPAPAPATNTAPIEQARASAAPAESAPGAPPAETETEAATPAGPTTTEPAAPIEPDAREAEHAPPHPTRRPKRTHPRPTPVPHAPASEPPPTAAPVERSRPVLDDATLDKVLPRPTGSP